MISRGASAKYEGAKAPATLSTKRACARSVAGRRYSSITAEEAIGGASICPQNRIKRKCKECGRASICEHNYQRCQCKTRGCFAGAQASTTTAVRACARIVEDQRYARMTAKGAIAVIAR